MKQSSSVTIAADHAAFAGHFPGAPLLPGVVLLDAVLQAVAASGQYPRGEWQISAAKFLKVVLPGESLRIEHEPAANGGVRFAISSGEHTVASGLLVPA